MSSLKHLTQPTGSSCVAACIAMVAGLEVKEVINRLTDSQKKNGVSLYEEQLLLSKLGIEWNQFIYPKIVSFGFYLITVPSLNFDGLLHRIVIESAPSGITVYDPNKGRDGAKYYAEIDDVLSFTEVVQVSPLTPPLG